MTVSAKTAAVVAATSRTTCTFPQMDDVRDPAEAERLDHVAPDEGMRRREFLHRTALTAGLAGLASVLPAETLIAEAAKRQTRVHLPAPKDMPVDTIVVLMMENRSFDHY